jgi:hypothetical protein
MRGIGTPDMNDGLDRPPTEFKSRASDRIIPHCFLQASE